MISFSESSVKIQKGALIQKASMNAKEQEKEIENAKKQLEKLFFEKVKNDTVLTIGEITPINKGTDNFDVEVKVIWEGYKSNKDLKKVIGTYFVINGGGNQKKFQYRFQKRSDKNDFAKENLYSTIYSWMKSKKIYIEVSLEKLKEKIEIAHYSRWHTGYMYTEAYVFDIKDSKGFIFKNINKEKLERIENISAKIILD
jgi:hypothetical protein